MVFLVAGCLEANEPKPTADGPKSMSAASATFIVKVETTAGKPVAGVGVRVLGGKGEPDRAVSDERGEVRFTAAEGTLQVIVDDPAYPTTMTYAELKAGESKREVLPLLAGTTLKGKVVDSAGNPVDGASIQILPYG